MKRTVLLLALVFLISFGFIIALPNPIYGYCTEMGYTYVTENETEICDFGDGNNCSLTEFYNGSCGTTYVVNASCAEAGERVGVITECCGNLSSIGEYSEDEGDCLSRMVIGVYGICSNCGDDVCEEWENNCSCPDDCEAEPSPGNTTCPSVCVEYYDLEQDCEFEDCGSGCLTIDNETRFNTYEECIEAQEEDEEDNETGGEGQGRIRAAIKHRNRLGLNESQIPEDCTVTGSVIRCNIEGGRVMVVMAGRSGNTVVKVSGVNMTTRSELYHHNGKVYGVFDDNETKAIEYLPDQIREIVRARIQAQIEGNETIDLTEEGEYRVWVRKRARFLGIFKVKEKVRFHIDPETGEILNIRAPWWSFLTIDVEEEETNSTNSTG